MDGNYLDKQSKTLTAEFLTYSADLRVMGYGRVTLEWQDNGAVTGGPALGVPACTYSSPLMTHSTHCVRDMQALYHYQTARPPLL